ncbi:MAG: xylulokinase [Clostridiales bacterium]|nr:xylulokinase [Clostridiales bacterium]
MAKFLIAHDLGTSGNKATLYGLDGKLYASSLYEYPTYYPGVNYVEQNPADWWEAVCKSTITLMEKAGVTASDIGGVSFSAQMMGCLLVDKDGEPLRPMIIWADQRSTKQADFLEKELGQQFIYKTTGHRISPAYSLEKLMWVRDNEPDVYKKAAKVLHAKDYIIYKLTGNFVTDYSDAGGMNLFDMTKRTWSPAIIAATGIRADLLPEVHPSSDIAGTITKEAAAACGLLEGTPVVIGGGDGSCATVGAGVARLGKTYCSMGSSAWISTAANEPFFDPEMRTFNWIHLDPSLYTPNGTMQTAGYSYSWVKNNLCDPELLEAAEKGISPYQLINKLAEKSPAGANNLLFLPYLLGERSPRWNPNTKGCFLGLTLTSTRNDMIRSVLEGVGYNMKVILDVINSKFPVEDIMMIGGGARGMEWLQMLADIWQRKLIVPEYIEEATSLGAAIACGVGIGAFPDFKVVEEFNKPARTIEPNPENFAVYEKLFGIFEEAYNGLTGVFAKLNS